MRKITWMTIFTYLLTIVFPIISYAKLAEIDPNTMQMMIDVTEGKPADPNLTGVFEKGIHDAIVQELKLVDYLLLTEAEKVLKIAFREPILSPNTAEEKVKSAAQTKAQVSILSALRTYRSAMPSAEITKMRSLLKKKGISSILIDRIKDTYTVFRSHEQLFMDGEPEQKFMIFKVKDPKDSPSIAVLAGLIHAGVIEKGSAENRAKVFQSLDAVITLQDTGELSAAQEASIAEAVGVNSSKGVMASGTAEAAEVGAKTALSKATLSKAGKKLASAIVRALVTNNTVTSMTKEHLNDPTIVRRIASKAWKLIEKRVPKKSAPHILKHARGFEKGIERVIGSFSSNSIKKAIAGAGSATAKAAIRASSSSLGKIVLKSVGGVFFAAVGDILVDTAATLIVGQSRGEVILGKDSYEHDSRKTTQQGDKSFWNDRGAALGGLSDDYQEHAITKTASTVGGAAVGIGLAAAAVAFTVVTGGVGLFLIAAVGAVAGAAAGSYIGQSYEESQHNKQRIKRSLLVRLTLAMKQMDITKNLPIKDIKTLASSRRDDFVLRLQNRQYRHLIKLVSDFEEDSIQLSDSGGFTQIKITPSKGEDFEEEAHTKYDFIDVKGFQGIWDMHENKIVNVGNVQQTQGRSVELVLNEKYKKVKIDAGLIKGKIETDDFRVLSNQVVMAKAYKNGKWEIRGYASSVDMFFRPLSRRYIWAKDKKAYVPLKFKTAEIPKSLQLAFDDKYADIPSRSKSPGEEGIEAIASQPEDSQPVDNNNGNASYDYSNPNASFMTDFGLSGEDDSNMSSPLFNVAPSDNTAVNTPMIFPLEQEEEEE